MLSLIVWWSGLVLELVILVRGLRARMILKYPYFYAYVLCVFVVSAGLYEGYRVSVHFYEHWYWPTQYATLLTGCGVLLEILDHALESYAGARRLLRGLCLGIFGTFFCYIGVKVVRHALWSTLVTSAEMERDLRVVQAVFLAAILGVVFYYGINLGRNVKGMILGFGAYVGISVMTLAIVAVSGNRFVTAWELLQSGSYLFALGVWTVTLWSYAPNPAPERVDRMELDYAELASRTRQSLEAIRSELKGATRQ
jgi:hypothetical protein